jgi:hypothetical protein
LVPIRTRSGVGADVVVFLTSGRAVIVEKKERVLREGRPRLHLILNERVETALRYLEPKEQRRVSSHLKILEVHDPENISRNYPKLAAEQDAKEMFLLRVSPRLRAIFWYPGDGSVVVEDLASHEVLSRHFRRIES